MLKSQQVLEVIPDDQNWYSIPEIIHLFNVNPEARYASDKSIKAHLLSLTKTKHLALMKSDGKIDFIDVGKMDGRKFVNRKIAKHKVNLYRRPSL